MLVSGCDFGGETDGRFWWNGRWVEVIGTLNVLAGEVSEVAFAQ
jgi:streptogramin lyase